MAFKTASLPPLCQPHMSFPAEEDILRPPALQPFEKYAECTVGRESQLYGHLAQALVTPFQHGLVLSQNLNAGWGMAGRGGDHLRQRNQDPQRPAKNRTDGISEYCAIPDTKNFCNQRSTILTASAQESWRVMN